MSHLFERDYQKILNFLPGLYGTKSFEELAIYIRDNLSKLIAGELTHYGRADFDKRQVTHLGGLPPMQDHDEIVQEHFYDHPYSRYYAETKDFSALKISDFLTQDDLHRSEPLYQRYLRRMGMEENMTLSFPVFWETRDAESDSGIALTVDSVGLFRKERSFTERDRTVLNLLQPHLMQAGQTIHALLQLLEKQETILGCLNASGCVILGSTGAVRHMSPKAEMLIQRYFEPSLEHHQGLPTHLMHWVNYQRSRLNQANDQLKPLVPLRLQRDRKQLTIRYAPDPDNDQHLLLFEEEQQTESLSIESLQSCGLTKREAEILFLIAEGKSNPEIADLLCVSMSTVRKHLEHIYTKLNVTTRAAAVVTALTKLGLLVVDSP